MKRPVLWSWACVTLVLSAGRNSPVQIATPASPTLLLACERPGCSVIFRANAPEVCIKVNVIPSSGTTTAQIALSPCEALGANVFAVKADGTASEGGFSLATTFSFSICGSSICNNGFTSVFAAAGGTLSATPTTQLTATAGPIVCGRQGLIVYPTSTPDGCTSGAGGPTGPSGPSGPRGPSGPSGPPPVGPCPSRTRRRVRITITNGTSAVAIAEPFRLHGDEYVLPLSDLEAGEDFYIQKYRSSTVGANGTIETVTSYTIQHVRSGQYIVADVLDNAHLKVADYSPGINLEDGSNFPPGYATLPDYRFFASYDVNLGDGIILCPLYHRSNCLLPAKKGYLRLASIRGSGQPTPNYSFVNPLPGVVSSFIATSAVRSGLVGQWYFKFIDPPTPLPAYWGK